MDAENREYRIAQVESRLRERPGFLRFVEMASDLMDYGWVTPALLILAAIGIPLLILKL